MGKTDRAEDTTQIANIQRANSDFFLPKRKVGQYRISLYLSLRVCVCVSVWLRAVSALSYAVAYSFRMHLIGWPIPRPVAVMSHAELKLIIAMQHNLLCHTAGHKQGMWMWEGG